MRLQVARRARAQAPFLLVLAVLAAAIVALVLGPTHWRRGIGVLSAAVLLAAVLRAVLPRPIAGLLAFRNRVFDTACYLLLGVAILIVDIRLPH